MSAVPNNVVPLSSHKLHPFVARAMEATSAEGVAIALRSGDDVICEASIGPAPEVGSKVQRGSSLSAECMRERRPVSFSHPGDATRPAYSAILAPMLKDGEAIGFCCAIANRANAFTRSDLRMLAAIAQAAAGSLTQAEPISPKPVAVEPPQSSAVSSQILKEVEEEIAAFASIQKRRARLTLAAKSACVTVLALGICACFFPDRVQQWTQPILYKLQHPLEKPVPQSLPQSQPSDKPSVAAAYAPGN